MPGSWDPDVYRARAKQWRDAVVSMPDSPTRKAYLVLADGYEKLADILEEERADKFRRVPDPPR
jgi:hypothetical protein